MKFATMTVDGGYGSDLEAETWEKAQALAELLGYDVLDCTQHAGENVLVVTA